MVVKVLRLPTLGFPVWGSSKGTDYISPVSLTLKARGLWLQDFHRSGESREPTFERTNRTLCAPGSRGKRQWPRRRLNETERQRRRVSCRSSGWQGFTVGRGRWQQQAWKACLGVSPTEGQHKPYHRAYTPRDWATLGQRTSRDGVQPHPPAIKLRFSWA